MYESPKKEKENRVKGKRKEEKNKGDKSKEEKNKEEKNKMMGREPQRKKGKGFPQTRGEVVKKGNEKWGEKEEKEEVELWDCCLL